MGKRLKPLTDRLPKSLIRVNNETILSRQINSIPKQYIREIVIVIGHEGKKIQDELTKMETDIKITFIDNKNYKKCNCGYSFSLTKNIKSGPVIYLNSDLMLSPSKIQMFLDNAKKNAVFVCEDYEYYTDFLRAKYNNKNIITFWPETGYGQDGNCILVGPFKMEHETHQIICQEFMKLNDVKKNNISCYGLFSKALNFKKFHAIKIEKKYFWEIDTYQDIIDAEKFFLDGRRS